MFDNLYLQAEDYEQAVEIFEKVYQKRVSQYGGKCFLIGDGVMDG